jgi:thiol-disulfide isomerase/thioredoxin
MAVRGHVLLLLCLVLAACDKSPPLHLQVGQQLPPLALVDLENRPHALGPAPGKLLMINVWATWCAPCRHELPSLQRLADRLGPEHFQLVGVSVDHDDYVVREFLIERKIRFPSLLDRNLAVANGVFGVRVFPSSFFVAPDGRVVRVIEGWREWDTPAMITEIRALLPTANKVEAGP